MDNDRTEGSMKKMKGDLKEGLGKLTGDEKMRQEGRADQVEGKAQNAWGGIKDTVRDATGDERTNRNR